MKNKWHDFFQKYRITETSTDEDLLFQVGTTVNGQTISKRQFEAIIDDISSHLQLQDNDQLLDLCCGNGIITYELSKKVKQVIGVDFSDPYIKVAQQLKNNHNTLYMLHDVTHLDQLKIHIQKCNKVVNYASLAYLTPVQFKKILGDLSLMTSSDVKIFIGSILDKSKIWKFFNSPKRKITYLFKHVLLRKDPGLGRWWTKKEIEGIARQAGFECKFFTQRPLLHTAHYRMDVLITRNEENLSMPPKGTSKDKHR